MTKKIALIGGPGSGKSTTSSEIYVAFKKLGYNVDQVPEWIRRDIAVNGPMESIWEQYRTLENHKSAEDDFPDATEFLIVDSGCLTPFFYAAIYAGKDNRREHLVVADMYKSLLKLLYDRHYDHIFFLPRRWIDSIGVNLNDGVRYQTQEEVTTLEEFMTVLFTKVHRFDNIHILDCPVGSRIENVVRVVLGEEGVERLRKVKERHNEQ